MTSSKFGLLLCLPLLLLSCGRGTVSEKLTKATEKPIGAIVEVRTPLGLPALQTPPDNPITAETVALGRKLFHDPRLSMNDMVACSSCHNSQQGFADGRKTSLGVDGKTGTRNAPTVLNAAHAKVQFWDGRASSLEEQAAGPISNPVEMNQGHDVCVAKLESDPGYKADFQNAFGPGPITIGKVQKALASFERTLISGNSAFDRYEFGGDKAALSAAAVRGLAIFKDPKRGNCVTCHTIEKTHAVFADGKFHNLGVGVNAEGELTDLGRFDQTHIESDKGAFKTPTLRNIAQTAPYMHDGSFKTLRDVVDFYAGGGNSNEHLDKEMKPLNLTRNERDDLVAFLESLTGEAPSDAQLISSK
jgi:cytochrome c peroxidase